MTKTAIFKLRIVNVKAHLTVIGDSYFDLESRGFKIPIFSRELSQEDLLRTFFIHGEIHKIYLKVDDSIAELTDYTRFPVGVKVSGRDIYEINLDGKVDKCIDVGVDTSNVGTRIVVKGNDDAKHGVIPLDTISYLNDKRLFKFAKNIDKKKNLQRGKENNRRNQDRKEAGSQVKTRREKRGQDKITKSNKVQERLRKSDEHIPELDDKVSNRISPADLNLTKNEGGIN
jgi:hypothetical protein